MKPNRKLLKLVIFSMYRWIHDYQEACVDKLERFLRGDITATKDALTVPISSSIHGAGVSMVQSTTDNRRTCSNVSTPSTDESTGRRDSLDTQKPDPELYNLNLPNAVSPERVNGMS